LNVVPHPSVPEPAPVVVEMPGDVPPPPESLGEAARAVWARQAPHAFRKGTLTVETEASFALYCRSVVDEVALHLTKMGTPDHRGMLQRVNAYELQFMLTADGKALVTRPLPSEMPQSRLARFRK
jgi:hypothetical protein